MKLFCCPGSVPWQFALGICAARAMGNGEERGVEGEREQKQWREGA